MSTNSVILRGLNEHDFDMWKALWNEYLVFYNSSVNELVYTKTFERIVSSNNTAQNAVVACEGEVLIGLVHFIFHPDNWTIEYSCYLQDLFVVEIARRRGIARSLIESVYAAADKRGCTNVYWLTQETNKPARALYDKLANATSFIEYSR